VRISTGSAREKFRRLGCLGQQWAKLSGCLTSNKFSGHAARGEGFMRWELVRE
jgi:hypothetical protein